MSANYLFEWTPPLKEWMKEYTFKLVQSIEELEDIINRAIASNLCAFDLESTGLDLRIYDGKCNSIVVGYSLSFEPKIGYYIPIRHNIDSDKGVNLPYDKVNPLIQKLINGQCQIVGHNWLKYDAEILLAAEGITLKEDLKPYPYHDTYILARLLCRNPSGLKHLSKVILNKEMFEIKDVVEAETRNINFADITPYQGLIYAASDAICTYELFKDPELIKPMTEQSAIYNLERKLVRVVRKMERNMVKLDMDHVKKMDIELDKRIKELEQSMFNELSEKTHGQKSRFVIDSPKEVAEILFDIFDMQPKPPKTQTGQYSTSGDILENLAKKYSFAKKMLEYRTVTKFHRTYIINMLKNVDKNGYLKFNFMQLKTDSGRFSSPGKEPDSAGAIDGYSNVNIQAIPARYDTSMPNIRKSISCESDEIIAALDWSGVEIRIATNLSKEPIWLDRFMNGDGDVHTSTGSIIYDKSESEVTKEERQISKTFNFQSMYGGGSGALSGMLGLTIEDAKEKQGKFFGRLKTLRAWIKLAQRFAEQKGYCLTSFGRKRLLPDAKSDDPRERAGAARKATNTPIQGTAADLMKFAMIFVGRWIEEKHLENDVQMLITMHDELVFRIKKNKIHLIEEIVEVMKLKSIVNSVKWVVPLEVDAEVGSSWDVEYDYFKMGKFLKTKNMTFEDLYKKDTSDYEKLLKEYKEYLDNKKKEKAIKAEEKSRDDGLKSFASTLVDKPSVEQVKIEETKEIVVDAIRENLQTNIIGEEKVSLRDSEPVIEESQETVQIEEPIIKSNPEDIKLKDLPLEAYKKLKRSFYEEEFKRLLKGDPSIEDDGIETYVIVHRPIDDSKKKTIGHIIDQCPGSSKVKFISQNKEELHDEWVTLDLLKMSVMCKIFHI